MNKRSVIFLACKTATVSLLATLTLVACTSVQPPVSEMAVAESAVERANAADTRTGAPAELQIAIAKLASARSAFEREDYALASQLAQQAQADAELAEAVAQAARAELAAEESQAAARALRDGINR